MSIERLARLVPLVVLSQVNLAVAQEAVPVHRIIRGQGDNGLEAPGAQVCPEGRFGRTSGLACQAQEWLELCEQSDPTRAPGRARCPDSVLRRELVRTSARGWLGLRFPPGVIAWLGPHSQARVQNMEPEISTLELLQGRLRVLISHIFGGQQFEVDVGSALAAARGTDFLIERSADGSVLLEVYEGTVEVLRDRQTGGVLVPAGQRAQVAVDGSVRGPEPIADPGLERGSLPPPAIQPPSPEYRLPEPPWGTEVSPSGTTEWLRMTTGVPPSPEPIPTADQSFQIEIPPPESSAGQRGH